MNVNQINFPTFQYNKKTNPKPEINKNMSDSFQKSNISFGMNFMDFLSTIIDAIDYEEKEMEIECIIDVFSDKTISKRLKTNKSIKMDEILDICGLNSAFNKGLFNDCGISTIGQFDNFLKIYHSNPKSKEIFERQNIEALQIYGMLNRKDDFAKYGELLLYLFCEEEEKRYPNYSILNKTSDFLKDSSVGNLDDFNKKYSYLKPYFEDFSNIWDISDAIEYLRETQKDKLSKLEEILTQTNITSKPAKEIYPSIYDIIDYTYLKNKKSLEGLKDIIGYALQQPKIKPQVLKQLSCYYDFQNPKDKIDFYNFLKESTISIEQLNKLGGKSPVSNSDITAKIKNKNAVCQKIQKTQNLNEEKSFELYQNFSDIFCALYDENNPDSKNIETFLNVINTFLLTNTDSFLNFYNKATFRKKRSLEADEIRDFVDLFKYHNSKDLLKEAKERDISAFELLNDEKETFLSIKDEIENFIISDESNTFLGKSPLEIYKDFRPLIKQDPKSISKILKGITNTNIQTPLDYERKTKAVNNFSHFFKNRQDVFEFFAKNSITFDGSEDDNSYQKNCLEILEILYDGKNPQASFDKIKFYAKSGFFKKSKDDLETFLKNTQYNSNTRKRILDIIYQTKIPSVFEFERFCDKYKTQNSSLDDFLDYLSELPQETSFSYNAFILDLIQKKLNALNIPLKLDIENIKRINTTECTTDGRITNSKLIKILDEIYSPKETNFLADTGINKDSKNQYYTSYRIAKEIAQNATKSDESYQNLVKLLKIDKEGLELNDDAGLATYAKTIAQKLPDEFIDFVNSNEYLDFIKDKQNLPYVSLHARLRAIDRFALNEINDIKDLYKKDSIDKLRNLFKTIYTKTPTGIESSVNKRITVDFNDNIRAIFAPEGELITVIQK